MTDTNGTGSGRKLVVLAVPESKDGEKTFWPRIGVAFRNRDGSIAILLDALPIGTNKLQVRELVPREDAASRGNGFETVEVRP